MNMAMFDGGMGSYKMDIIDVSATFFYCFKLYPSCTPITHLKLQKLMYYAQGFSMARNGMKIFDECFEAWDHGPVCRRLYDEYKGMSYYEIPDEMVKGDPKNILENCNVWNIIMEVWRVFGKMSGKQLEMLTHRELPWISAMKKGRNTQFSDQEMQSFFSDVLYCN